MNGKNIKIWLMIRAYSFGICKMDMESKADRQIEAGLLEKESLLALLDDLNKKLKSKNIFKASLQTHKFEFEAYGENEDELIKILERGVRKHCKQYKVNVEDFWKEYPKKEIQITQIYLNKAYRDYEEI